MGASAIALALGAACSGGGGGGATAGLDHLPDSGELRWGADRQGGEPFVYEDPAHPDQLTGFEVDLAAALSQADRREMLLAFRACHTMHDASGSGRGPRFAYSRPGRR